MAKMHQTIIATANEMGYFPTKKEATRVLRRWSTLIEKWMEDHPGEQASEAVIMEKTRAAIEMVLGKRSNLPPEVVMFETLCDGDEGLNQNEQILVRELIDKLTKTTCGFIEQGGFPNDVRIGKVIPGAFACLLSKYNAMSSVFFD